MLSVNINTSELAQIHRAVEEAENQAGMSLAQIFTRGGALMEREIKESMKEGGKLGRSGPRGGKATMHSRAGEPPYVQTGRLRASIGYVVERYEHACDLIIGAIRKVSLSRSGHGRRDSNSGGEVVYARNLELGITMSARPFLYPVVKRFFDTFGQEFGRAFSLSFRKYAR